ncbi:MAG: Mur ligase domain-containing protein, partial [Verrucomicrobiaceae bacterium]|nr:Mur ligase domain-containing protein [Verrucomicrobiaceae bacterium]
MMLASEIDLPQMLVRERHRIHLIGVAGSGMSGIAALLLELGHDVSGSDKVGSLETDRLQRLGLRFHLQHRAEDAAEAELVIYSSAIKETNPILARARLAGKPLVRRA